MTLPPLETSTAEVSAAGSSTGEVAGAASPAGRPAASRARAGPRSPAAGGTSLELPRIRALLLHALPRFVEGVVAPVVVFYAALAMLGLNGALVAAVAWVYGGIVFRYLRGHPVSGMLLLAAVGVTVRAGLAAATHSAVVYFLQPTLGTLMVSMAFLASVPLGRPLAMKLARDMAPIPRRSSGTTRSAGSSCASRCCGRWCCSPTSAQPVDVVQRVDRHLPLAAHQHGRGPRRARRRALGAASSGSCGT